MDPAIIGSVVVVVLCLVGGAIVGSAQNRKEQAEFTQAVDRLLPGARLTIRPPIRGSFGAELAVHGRIFIFAGDYMPDEGGDGFMHVYEARIHPDAEVGRVPLGSHKFHWPVMKAGVEILSKKIHATERAEPGAADNPEDAQRVREDH